MKTLHAMQKLEIKKKVILDLVWSICYAHVNIAYSLVTQAQNATELWQLHYLTISH